MTLRAKVKEGVRPFGGRTFDVLEEGTYRSGREYVELDVPSDRTKFGLLGKTSSPRRYYLDEVEFVEPRKSSGAELGSLQE